MAYMGRFSQWANDRFWPIVPVRTDERQWLLLPRNPTSRNRHSFEVHVMDQLIGPKGNCPRHKN